MSGAQPGEAADAPPGTAGRSMGAAFVAGALFALGLGVSGMTKPTKVVAFLDIAGAWDPSLAFVMLGAIGVYGVARRLILRRAAPLAGGAFAEPRGKAIDAPLVLGAACFGVGWALGGFCPGPAIVSAGSGSGQALVFVLAMAAGVGLHAALPPRRRAEAPDGAPPRAR